MTYRKLSALRSGAPATTATSATTRLFVAGVAVVAAPPRSTADRVRLLCPDHAEELLAFWQDDHDDLIDLPDEAILALAQDYLRHRDYYRTTIESNDTTDDSAVLLDGVRVAVARSVCCADCLWFERRPDYNHVGHCLVGEPEPIVGLRDTDRRACSRFITGLGR